MKRSVDELRAGADSPGETLRDGRTLPGLLLAVIAIVAVAISLYLFGVGRSVHGQWSAVAAMVLGAAGVVWLIVEHRRVVRLNERSRGERSPGERSRRQ